MRKSMTGFGKAGQTVDGFQINVEMRSLNSRYLELLVRVPRGYGFLEESLKQLVQAGVARGKVELTLTVTPTGENALQITCNEALAERYLTSLRTLGAKLGLADDITLASVAKLEGVLVTEPPPCDEKWLTQAVLRVAESALSELVSMRDFEGERLAADLTAKLDEMDQLVEQIQLASPQAVEQYKNRLTQRMEGLLQPSNSAVDPMRMLTEVALFAERTAIDEELVRLTSHLEQFRKTLDAPGPVGRKLDFMVQELGREVNCIGSKASDVTITSLVVEGKSLLEKMREQLQNLE